jgi:AraC-like DNA-binding protein
MSEVGQFAYRPQGFLRHYVHEILWIHSKHPRTQILLPETVLTMLFRQSGAASLLEAKLPDKVISGLQQRARLVDHTAGSSLVVVRFTEVGAPAVLRDRVDLLFNRTEPLDAVLPRQEIEDVQSVLADSRDKRRQYKALEGFLRSRIGPQIGSSPAGISPQIQAAARLIRESAGRASVAAIARRVAMGQSTLERHFRAAVGATPKMLSRLARLQHVCQLWDTGKSLTEIAFEAGYSDQPHLVHDFRSFTGRSPEEFFLSNTPRNLPISYK